MQFDVKALILSLLSISTVVAGVAWVIKSLIGKVLDAGIEKYKQRLSKEAERHKAELTLAYQLFLQEHAPRFTILAERRAEVICDLYSNLLRAYQALESDFSYPGITRITAESEQDKAKQLANFVEGKENAHREASDAIKAFEDYFFRNRIYFSAELCTRIEVFLGALQKIYGKLEYQHWYRRNKPHPSWPAPDFTVNSWNDAVDELNRTLEAIDVEFRTLLGVSGTYLRKID
jgi:hypothetical protein